MPRNLLLPCFGALAAHVKWQVASKVASEVWSKVGRSGPGEKPISALGKCRNREVCVWCECLLAEKQRKIRAKHTAESLFFEKQSFQPCVSLSFFCVKNMLLVVSGGWKKTDFQHVRGLKKTDFQQVCFVCGEIALPVKLLRVLVT